MQRHQIDGALNQIKIQTQITILKLIKLEQKKKKKKKEQN